MAFRSSPIFNPTQVKCNSRFKLLPLVARNHTCTSFTTTKRMRRCHSTSCTSTDSAKHCQSMTAIFVRDFGLAKISFTIPGTLKLQKAWAEFTGGDFVSGKDIDVLLDAINREFYKGPADHIEDQLYQTSV
ncbi:hypothetical protein TWF102_003008 [Orbilia oligospora]|uniref:Uncharacterized protein n=1 Tax=Orbilia oligospora TaxID=2813651 RepID=A0A7C8NR80_ORBOL|nr:hypothetical protein TWF102_003008 [Orbilia oligospora]KAF3109317.1 hypothetical protein TWF103_005193 [Orbilia oligospora]KAF3147255.1 hypothetical protein TWF703_000095 [Orbilia oligospora]KAF3150488.1 hypothetical protein TWF594_009132 [Orbilia oligospora]